MTRAAAPVVASRASLLSGHLPALDGLRGLAILLVLVHNLDIFAPSHGVAVWARAYKEAAYVGWIGVQLFFVLSGFLITRGLLATRSDPHYFRNFYARRALRIFPLYYLALVMFTLVLPSLGVASVQPTHGTPFWLWVYLSNWTQTVGLGGDQLPHFWSLAIEEQFYLVWPLLLWRRSPRQVLALSLSLVLAGPVLRAAMLYAQVAPSTVYVSTFGRVDALAAGAALAAFLALPGTAPRALNRQVWLSLFGLSAVLAVLGSHGFQRLSPAGQVLGYSLLAAMFTAAVAAAAGQDLKHALPSVAPHWHRLLCSAPLRAVGRYSYAIYVFHKPLDEWLGQRLLMAWQGSITTAHLGVALLYLAGIGAMSVLMAVASWHLFERHFLQLKVRFEAGGARGTQRAAWRQSGMPVPSR